MHKAAVSQNNCVNHVIGYSGYSIFGIVSFCFVVYLCGDYIIQQYERIFYLFYVFYIGFFCA